MAEIIEINFLTVLGASGPGSKCWRVWFPPRPPSAIPWIAEHFGIQYIK